MCWLALKWDSWICKLKNFYLLNNVYNLFRLIWIFFSFFSLIQSFGFKGCSWKPLPAHFRFTDWHNNGIFEFASSRASVWSAVLCIMLFGLNLLRAFCIGSSHARKKITTTLHFDYCGKTKSAVILISHRVDLRQLTCQNIWKGKALACAKQDSTWGL